MTAATPAIGTAHRASPFSKRTVFALVVASFLAFIALLALIGDGQTSRQSNDGGSHAAANGLNGYAGLVELLRSQGRDVSVSRTPSSMDTYGLLVLTPPMNADPEEIQKILEDRFYQGPTLIILPKWYAQRLNDDITDDVRIEDGWVNLSFAAKPSWIDGLEEPYWLAVQQPWTEEMKRLERELERRQDAAQKANADDEAASRAKIMALYRERRDLHKKLPDVAWSGLGLGGALPEGRYNAIKETPGHTPLISTSDGMTLVTAVTGEEDSDFWIDAYPVTIVIEPDLMNNYGLSDRDRAAAALAIIDQLNYNEYGDEEIIFDVTLNGLGGSENLLTLAFRPPFLAATLCLIFALIIVGWRAFLRFGPAFAEEQSIAFGKHRLVSNGAGLILRARRLGLLAEPYIALTNRRLAARLGMPRADHQTISETLSRRFPNEEPLINRANALRDARKPKDILRAARSLKELERKLER